MVDDTQAELPRTMQVIVVTPLRHVLAGSVTEITAFGALGEFGVLPGHIPLLTMLGTGVLVLDRDSGREVYAHGPGYLEIGERGQVKILLEQATLSSSIDAGTAKSDFAEAEAQLAKVESTETAEWKNAAAKRDWAAACIDAIRR